MGVEEPVSGVLRYARQKKHAKEWSKPAEEPAAAFWGWLGSKGPRETRGR